MEEHLNPAQQAAVLHKEGPLLVLAGPGSGKTKVITERMIRLMETGVSLSELLVVTFTRAAAAEMQERFRKRTACTAPVAIGTFHSIFFRILKASLKLDGSQILPEEERMKIIRNILHSVQSDRVRERDLPELIAREISLVKGSETSLEHFYSGALSGEGFREVFRLYEQYKKEHAKIDFDDILSICGRLLSSRKDILAFWQKKFRYIMVDEFQDISPLQYRITRMLALPENHLMIVGDDDQSIYRFRGASPGIMLNFPKEFPEARVIRLSVNYRCTPEILEAASALISHNRQRFAKALTADKPSGRPVRKLLFSHPAEEARHISEEIRKLVLCGFGYEQFAVLFRANFDCRPIVQQFISDQIPFFSADVIPCVYDHWIAGCIFSYLELGAGGRRRSDFLRIYNRPNRYISREVFLDAEISFHYLYDYYEDKEWMCDRIEQLEQDLRMIGTLSPASAVVYIRNTIGFDQYVREFAAEQRLAPEDLLSVLDELTDAARQFDSLEEWKSGAEAFRENLRREKQIQNQKKGVMISTLHASKGTEYDFVYIPELNEGIIPYKKAKLEADIEEERRMLYVGMTRAREVLTLSRVKERYNKQQICSRFWEEVWSK